jgi:hypothetical protein
MDLLFHNNEELDFKIGSIASVLKVEVLEVKEKSNQND